MTKPTEPGWYPIYDELDTRGSLIVEVTWRHPNLVAWFTGETIPMPVNDLDVIWGPRIEEWTPEED